MGAFSNAKQNIPKVFLQIQENQERRAVLKDASVITLANVREYRELKLDMDNSLRPAAEKLLHWNRDKGDGVGGR